MVRFSVKGQNLFLETVYLWVINEPNLTLPLAFALDKTSISKFLLRTVKSKIAFWGTEPITWFFKSTLTLLLPKVVLCCTDLHVGIKVFGIRL